MKRRCWPAVLLAVVLLAAGCTAAGDDATASQVPGPDDIPVPPGAELLDGGEVATYRVPDASSDDVIAFLGATLPDTGWTVVESWEGEDGHGLPSAGFVIERDDEVGAVAVTDHDEGALVRINLRQPEYRTGGMEGGPGG